MTTTNYIWGLGRRKTSTARVRIQPGAGAFFINGRPLDNFFPVLEHRNRATRRSSCSRACSTTSSRPSTAVA